MAKSETSNPKNVPSFEGPRYRPKWLAASICFLLGAWIAVTLLDYDPRQSHEYQVGGQSAWNGTVWARAKPRGAPAKPRRARGARISPGGPCTCWA